MLRIDPQLFPWNQLNRSASICAERCWVNSQRVNLYLMNLTSLSALNMSRSRTQFFLSLPHQSFQRCCKVYLLCAEFKFHFLSAHSSHVHCSCEECSQISIYCLCVSSNGRGKLCPLGVLSSVPSHIDLFHLKICYLQTKPSCCKETMRKRSMSKDKEKALDGRDQDPDKRKKG